MKNHGKLIFAAILSLGLAQAAQAFDKARYEAIATHTIQAAISGAVTDVDALIAEQQELVRMGAQACNDYAQQSPQHAKLMQLVADNAERMPQLTLDEIEAQWHDGELLAEHGIDFDALEHFGPAISLMDSVVHPATAIIALREYKSSGDTALLHQVKDELAEVLEHIDHIH